MKEFFERSSDCAEMYRNSNDPWGNSERSSYQIAFKGAVEKALAYFKESNPEATSFKWYDLGAGGGNILDTVLKSNNTNLCVQLGACDISPEAMDRVTELYKLYSSDVVDLERYNYEESPLSGLSEADIVSLVDVAYLFGDVRDYKLTLDEIWKTLKPGAILISADTLIRNFRRSYFSKCEGSVLLESYIDYSRVFREELNSSGKKFTRNLKVLIYKKQ